MGSKSALARARVNKSLACDIGRKPHCYLKFSFMVSLRSTQVNRDLRM